MNTEEGRPEPEVEKEETKNVVKQLGSLKTVWDGSLGEEINCVALLSYITNCVMNKNMSKNELLVLTAAKLVIQASGQILVDYD